jgi:hypothetical protein
VLAEELSRASRRERTLAGDKARLEAQVQRRELELREATARRDMEAARASAAERAVVAARAEAERAPRAGQQEQSDGGLRHIVNALRSDLMIRERIGESLEKGGKVAEMRAKMAEKRLKAVESGDVPKLRDRIKEVGEWKKKSR